MLSLNDCYKELKNIYTDYLLRITKRMDVSGYVEISQDTPEFSLLFFLTVAPREVSDTLFRIPWISNVMPSLSLSQAQELYDLPVLATRYPIIEPSMIANTYTLITPYIKNLIKQLEIKYNEAKASLNKPIQNEADIIKYFKYIRECTSSPFPDTQELPHQFLHDENRKTVGMMHTLLTYESAIDVQNKFSNMQYYLERYCCLNNHVLSKSSMLNATKAFNAELNRQILNNSYFDEYNFLNSVGINYINTDYSITTTPFLSVLVYKTTLSEEIEGISCGETTRGRNLSCLSNEDIVNKKYIEETTKYYVETYHDNYDALKPLSNTSEDYMDPVADYNIVRINKDLLEYMDKYALRAREQLLRLKNKYNLDIFKLNVIKGIQLICLADSSNIFEDHYINGESSLRPLADITNPSLPAGELVLPLISGNTFMNKQPVSNPFVMSYITSTIMQFPIHILIGESPNSLANELNNMLEFINICFSDINDNMGIIYPTQDNQSWVTQRIYNEEENMDLFVYQNQIVLSFYREHYVNVATATIEDPAYLSEKLVALFLLAYDMDYPLYYVGYGPKLLSMDQFQMIRTFYAAIIPKILTICVANPIYSDSEKALELKSLRESLQSLL